MYTVFRNGPSPGDQQREANEAELTALRQRLSPTPMRDLESFYRPLKTPVAYTETRAPAVVQKFVQA